MDRQQQHQQQQVFIVNGKDKRTQLLADFQQWNSAEQMVFLVDCMKFLSLNLIKFISAICNDLIEKQAYVNKPNSRLLNTNTTNNNNNNNSSSSNASDLNEPTSNQKYSNILQEQANDIMYFRVLSEKPVENKLKIMLSYLPLLRVQTHNYDLNESLKKAYQDQFQDVFKHCFRNKMCLGECYELSLLASLHPIFDAAQQTNFCAWTQLFETSLQKSSWSPNQQQSQQLNSVLLPGYHSNENLLKEKAQIDSNYYSMQQNDDHLNGTSDSLSDYKLHSSFDNDLMHPDFDSASASLNLSLHMQSTQSGRSNSAHTELNETSINTSANNMTPVKSLLNRQHLPLKLSTSLPPQINTSNGYSRAFNSLNPYDDMNDLNSSASSMNNFPLGHMNNTCNNNNSNNNNSNTKQNDTQNYSLNSYSDFDYVNLENIMIPPLSSSSSSVHSVLSQNQNCSKKAQKSSNEKSYESKKENNDNHLIKNISQWLKHLRLHKYTDYFCSMTYDDILSLNDDKLVESNITLGARKKILSNIEKLKNRPERIKQLINILIDEKCPLNLSTLENILNELTEISLTPMKAQNSPPTSLAMINSKQPVNVTSGFDSNDLSQLFIELLDKIQKFLTKQKSEGNYREEHGELAKLKELTLIYVKIIDKLFLTKAFTDVQNSQMAKLRNSVYDKSQNSKLDASYNVNMNSNGIFRNSSLSSKQSKIKNGLRDYMHTSRNIFRPYMMENMPDSNASNLNSYTNSSELNVNSVNALQRIKQKTSNNTLLSRTASMPFSADTTNASNQQPQQQQQQQQQQKTRAFNQQIFLNYSNKNVNN